MSLYDLYFSDKNKKHMYMLLDQITSNRLQEPVFNSILNETFEKSTYENLLDLNKELLENICKYYKISNIDDNREVNQNRDDHLVQDIPVNQNRDDHLVQDIPVNQNRDDHLVQDIPVNQNINVNRNDKPDYKTGYISSINKFNGNRFSYSIKLDNNINRIKKLVIPIENNDVFVNNTLKLIIPELGVDTICYCNSTNNIKNRTYGCYIPEDMIVKKKSDTINVSIMSLLGNDSYRDDIEIVNDESDIYTTESIYDILVGDILRSTNKNNYKVIDIKDNNITFNKKLNNKDSNFVNINLQNIITYEY